MINLLILIASLWNVQLARAEPNVELELASIAEQELTPPLVDRICEEVPIAGIYTEMQCRAIARQR